MISLLLYFSSSSTLYANWPFTMLTSVNFQGGFNSFGIELYKNTLADFKMDGSSILTLSKIFSFSTFIENTYSSSFFTWLKLNGYLVPIVVMIPQFAKMRITQNKDKLSVGNIHTGNTPAQTFF